MRPVEVTYEVGDNIGSPDDSWTLHYFATPKRARMASSVVHPSWGRSFYRRAAELARQAVDEGRTVSGWCDGYGTLTAVPGGE